jgi:penicillin-binding protein 1A
MRLLAEAAASRRAHVEPASRAGVAREQLLALTPRLGDGHSSAAGWLRVTWARVGARLTAVNWRRAACFVAPPLILLSLPVVGLAYHVFFDRSGLPDIEPFIRFTPPAIGEVYDARGTVLIRLAREYRRVVSYDEVPPVLRHAILSAEDKHFFTHSGVDFRAWPRVLQKTAALSLTARGTGEAGLRLGQGGSTLTQQLVRGYFLKSLTSREGADVLVRGGVTPRLLSTVLGVSSTNKLLRKLEEIRLALWLEAEMRRHYGSPERAKREIFARYASFIYLGHGRYGFAAGSEYYFSKPLSSYGPEDAGTAALLAGIMKSPRDYAPSLVIRDRCVAATRSWP